MRRQRLLVLGQILPILYRCPHKKLIWSHLLLYFLHIFIHFYVLTKLLLAVLIFLIVLYTSSRSRDSVAGIATGYGLDEGGVRVWVPVVSRIHSSPQRPDRLWGPIQWVPGTLSPVVKRQGREADHSPPTISEVKKMWIYTSIPLYAFMA
jgi:hypothetical protein